MAYNKIFNEKDWDEVNKENKDIMDDYILECKARKKKPGTISQYTNDLRIILIYILKQCKNKSILELSKKDFRNLSLWCSEELMVSNARTNRLMSACRSLLDFCENEEEYGYNNNAAKKVKGLGKESVRDIVFLTDEEILGMKKYLIEKEEYQKATLLMLLYDSTARKNEVAQVLKESFYDKEKNFTNKVVGKRGKIFTLLYFDGTSECAKLWLEQRGSDDIKELFIVNQNNKKKAATSDNIYDWIVSLRIVYAILYGKKSEFNVHSMRHSSIENYSNGTHYICKKLGKNDGFPAETIQKMARHSDVSTTMSYMKKKDDEELAKAFGVVIE